MPQTIWSKVLFGGIALLIAGLAVYFTGSPLWIGVVISSIAALVLGFKFGVEKEFLAFLSLLSSYFLMEVIWVSFSENTANGWKNVVLKLSIVILPWCLLGVKHELSRKRVVALLNTYYLIMLSSAILYLAIAIFKSIQAKELLIFYNHLSLWTHPGYYSLLICGAALIGLFMKSSDHFGSRKMGRWFKPTTISFLVMMVFLLSARMQIGVLILILILFAFLAIRGKKKNNRPFTYYTALLLVAAVSAGVVFKSNTRVKRTYNEITEWNIIPGAYLSSTEIRAVIWTLGWEAFLEAPLKGHGTGSSKSIIHEKGVAKGHPQLANSRMGAHNEYMDALITKGVFGLVTLLCILFYPFIKAIKNRNPLLLSMSILFIFTLMTESAFEREVGVILFAILIPLSMLYQKPQSHVGS